MNWLDTLLGRKEPVSLSVTFPAPKPKNFCEFCGEPMVDGYMVAGRQFDPETGSPVLKVRRNRICMTLHRKDIPTPEYEDGELIDHPMSKHSGFSFWHPGGWFGYSDPYDYIPDCEPRKKAAK